MAKKVVQASFSGKSKPKSKKRLGRPVKFINLEKRSREYLTVAEVNKLINRRKQLADTASEAVLCCWSIQCVLKALAKMSNYS